MGNKNAITYKEIFPLLKENKMWLGESIHSGALEFGIPDTDEIINNSNCRIDEKGHRYVQISGARWYTNIDTDKSYRHEELPLCKSYYKHPELYPKYDNYDAINVDKVADIPEDYWGEMGVPITFLDKYNPEQFEIVGSFNASSYEEKSKNEYVDSKDTPTIINGVEKLWNGPVINKKPLYKRIVIKRRRKAA